VAPRLRHFARGGAYSASGGCLPASAPRDHTGGYHPSPVSAPAPPLPRPRSYVFHYQVADGIIYLCLADEQQARRLPFLFLADIKDRFTAQYGDRAKTAIAFAMNTEFSRVLSDRMEFFNENPAADQFGKVRGQLAEVKDIMMDNIGAETGERWEGTAGRGGGLAVPLGAARTWAGSLRSPPTVACRYNLPSHWPVPTTCARPLPPAAEKVLQRGEKIELLVDKSEQLSQSARKFQKQSKSLKNVMWWKNVKLWGLIGVLLLIIILVICMSVCGASFQNCSGK
jgi:hypothetical protein